MTLDDDWIARTVSQAPEDRPVLIAGPTASGKSALALALARAQGRSIINADALQVYRRWRILTARPDLADEKQAQHHLYGHVERDADWSVGHWLRAVSDILARDHRPVIVGGTGLYFTALTSGLAEIPPTPPAVRAQADSLRAAQGADRLLADLDAATLARIDTANPARVQRAWEVQRATGRGLADWHAATGAPLLPLDRVWPLVLGAEKDWLYARIDTRFDAMMEQGALAEVRVELQHWDPAHPSSRAIGAAELVAHLKGELDLHDAIAAAKRASRQYAKRQRTWMRNRLGHWSVLPLPVVNDTA